jgi:hypothetical protein
MAIERRHVAAVTRSWGGDAGEAIYRAYRVPLPPTEGAMTVRIGNEYRSAGQAINAVHGSFGRFLKWERNDIKQDIENYDGYLSVTV